MHELYSTRVEAPITIDDCHNDFVSLNPQGRLGDDEQHDNNVAVHTVNRNILSPKFTTYIGTFNTRTLIDQNKRSELAHLFEMRGVHILSIQEHRIIHIDEPIQITALTPKTYMLTSSAWRNTANAAVGGVGIVMTKNAYQTITEIKSISPRILSVTFNGNPKCTVISTYSPTEVADEETVKEFQSELSRSVNRLPQHNMVIIAGDLNAHLGRRNDEDKCWYFHTRTNSNGSFLRDTAMETGMEITNLRFQKRKGKLWTFLSDATHTKAQLDFIMVNKKWKRSVKDTEAFNWFNSLGSDHRLVLSKIKLSLSKVKQPERKIKYDWSAFKEDTNLQQRYSIAVRNRYSLLCQDDDDSNNYDHLVTAIAEENINMVPKVKKKKRLDIPNDVRVCQARNDLMLAKDKHHENPTVATGDTVAEKKEAFKSAYNVALEENLVNKIRRVENAHDRCKNKESWSVINEITGRNISKSCLIKGNSPEERKNTWLNHFRNLLGQPPDDNNTVIRNQHEGLRIDTGPFSMDEYKAAKSKISEGKAGGEDGIVPEILKRCNIDDIVLEHCNRALENGHIPESWKISTIIPIPKKGDLTDPNNHRGIAITSQVAKTLNRMILNRLRPEVEKLLRDNQNGFRESRSTTSHILTLRRVLEEAKNQNLAAVLVFIDFKKAFDSVHRGTLMKILRAYGIPKEIVDLIEKLYTDTKAQVLTPEGLTELFDIMAGVLQGDTLAPYLFIIVVDHCMKLTLENHPDIGFTLKPARSKRHKAIKLADIEFADDIALLANSAIDAQTLLQTVEEIAASVGLKMNESKTKYMTEGNIEGNITSLNGENIEKVEDFVYLGSKIRASESDIDARKAKAWAACHKLKQIWKSDLRKAIKVRLFTALIESVLLYGSETWTMTKRLNKVLDGCYTRMLRMALNVNQYRDRVSNAELYGDLPRVSFKVRQKRLRLAGHAIRHPELPLSKVILWKPVHGHRGRGRPRATFVDNLLIDTGVETTGELETLMLDRMVWRRVIQDPRAAPADPP